MPIVYQRNTDFDICIAKRCVIGPRNVILNMVAPMKDIGQCKRREREKFSVRAKVEHVVVVRINFDIEKHDTKGYESSPLK